MAIAYEFMTIADENTATKEVSKAEETNVLGWAREWLEDLETKATISAANVGKSAHQSLTGETKKEADLIHNLASTQLFHQKHPKELGNELDYGAVLAESTRDIEENEQLTNLTVGLYTLLTKLSEKRGSLESLQTSNVVENNTPWEYFLSVQEKGYRATNASIETGEGKPIAEESMAKVALLWLARNNGSYQNQPLDCVLFEKNGAFDPRIKTGKFKAALRQENGKYKVISINDKYAQNSDELNMGNEDLFVTQEQEVENPTDVQIVVDNRAVSPGYGYEINQQLDCAAIGIASTNEGVIIVNGDHLYMDGVAKIEMSRHLAKFAEARKTDKLNPQETKGEHYRPLITLENIAPSLSNLSPTEMMAAYARTMLDPEIGFSENQTILVPQIEKDEDSTLPNQNNRIQPLAIRLDDLAVANEKDSEVKKTLKKTRNDITQAGLHHAMTTANDPRIPKPIQKTLVKVLHKLPVVGPVGESFNGVGLISTPASAETNPIEEQNYGQPQRTPEQYHLISNTIVSQAERAFNLTVIPNGNGENNFCLAGSPDTVRPGDLVKFAHILERNSQDILRQKEEAKETIETIL